VLCTTKRPDGMLSTRPPIQWVGDKAAGAGSDLLFPFSDEITNDGATSSLPPYDFMAFIGISFHYTSTHFESQVETTLEMWTTMMMMMIIR